MNKRNLWTTLLTLETLLSNNKLVQSYDNKLRTLRNHYLLFEKKIVLIYINLNLNHLRMVCAKFGRSRLSGLEKIILKKDHNFLQREF